jgi:hypothetical protein
LRGSDERAENFSSEVLQRLSGRSGSFGREQLKGEIARGGMGAIVKAWDEERLSAPRQQRPSRKGR